MSALMQAEEPLSASAATLAASRGEAHCARQIRPPFSPRDSGAVLSEGVSKAQRPKTAQGGVARPLSGRTPLTFRKLQSYRSNFRVYNAIPISTSGGQSRGAANRS